MADIAVIVPHTHWDREWYLPFQKFRHNLVGLIDTLLDILRQQDYQFMLDGQTVVLEDYFEIRPERQEELLQLIRKGKIVVGPWYILPDEWLVGGESLVRNLEYSHELSRRLDIPLMQIAYLPDQFGHTCAIPQIVCDLTRLRASVLWRGVPPTITTTVFMWRSASSSDRSLLTVYMPGGYGNRARLPEEYDQFVASVREGIDELRPFSPVPVYLLMNGSDHLFPQPCVPVFAKRMSKESMTVTVGSLNDYLDALEVAMREHDYRPPEWSGELRSPARAPLLQDTYSSRMWIKQWNQRVEDLLVLLAEPVSTYLCVRLGIDYPTGFLRTAWRWLLQNQPHDSICGCSVDQTHEEMRARFSWSQSIAEAVIDSACKTLRSRTVASEKTSVLVFCAGPTMPVPQYFEFTMPAETVVRGLRTLDGRVYAVQQVRSQDDVFLDTTIGTSAAKMSLRFITGRKLMDFYINGVEYHDGAEPGLLELRISADRHPVGEFDVEQMKRMAHELFSDRRYKRVHIVAARPTQHAYGTVIPLTPWSFNLLTPVAEAPESPPGLMEVDRDHVSTSSYTVLFNSDGSLSLLHRESGKRYERLHIFEDYGDRGDEYTFSRVGPNHAVSRRVRRRVLCSGPLMAEIEQTLQLELREDLDESRTRRVGRVTLPVRSVFRFYRDSPRIEITTQLVNHAKNHRLRVCFNLPFSSRWCVTATHFGCVKRPCDPEPIPDEATLNRTHSTYPERPSGVQAQKRFIRVDEESGPTGITVFNRGLPEVEVVDEKYIALTLLRSVGALSRSDFPERPMHAGPAEATPGALELGVPYEFRYGILVHPSCDPLSVSADVADAAFEAPLVMTLDHAEISPDVYTPIAVISNPSIRISSLRMRDSRVLLTMFNQSDTTEDMVLRVPDQVHCVEEVRIDGSVIRQNAVKEGQLDMRFSPREIKMCSFDLSLK